MNHTDAIHGNRTFSLQNKDHNLNKSLKYLQHASAFNFGHDALKLDISTFFLWISLQFILYITCKFFYWFHLKFIVEHFCKSTYITTNNVQHLHVQTWETLTGGVYVRVAPSLARHLHQNPPPLHVHLVRSISQLTLTTKPFRGRRHLSYWLVTVLISRLLMSCCTRSLLIHVELLLKSKQLQK